MTKKDKKPEFPPGKACFPQPPAIKPTELDPKTLRTRSMAIDELHRLNHSHTVRWLRVLEMYEMPAADFKKSMDIERPSTRYMNSWRRPMPRMSGRRLLRKAAT